MSRSVNTYNTSISLHKISLFQEHWVVGGRNMLQFTFLLLIMQMRVTNIH